MCRLVPALLILLSPLVTAAQTDKANQIVTIPLEYNSSEHSLQPKSGFDIPTATNGDDISFELVTPHELPITVRRLAYRFNYKTQYKKRRGGIAGFFGGKTTVIEDHPLWVFVDVTAKDIGEKSDIIIRTEVKGEKPLFPSRGKSQRIPQVMKGGGAIGIGGTVTSTAAAFEEARKKVEREHVAPEKGYELTCENENNPRIAEAGGKAESLANPPATLEPPEVLTFSVKVVVNSSR